VRDETEYGDGGVPRFQTDEMRWRCSDQPAESCLRGRVANTLETSCNNQQRVVFGSLRCCFKTFQTISSTHTPKVGISGLCTGAEFLSMAERQPRANSTTVLTPMKLHAVARSQDQEIPLVASELSISTPTHHPKRSLQSTLTTRVLLFYSYETPSSAARPQYLRCFFRRLTTIWTHRHSLPPIPPLQALYLALGPMQRTNRSSGKL